MATSWSEMGKRQLTPAEIAALQQPQQESAPQGLEMGQSTLPASMQTLLPGEPSPNSPQSPGPTTSIPKEKSGVGIGYSPGPDGVYNTPDDEPNSPSPSAPNAPNGPATTPQAPAGTTAAYNRAKDMIGQQMRASIMALNDAASERGQNVAGGSNPALTATTGRLLQKGGQELSEVVRDQEIEAQRNAEDEAKMRLAAQLGLNTSITLGNEAERRNRDAEDRARQRELDDEQRYRNWETQMGWSY